ncbi:MAG: Hpt domain-containing protein [Methanomicrobium sp.]|nr:Hpt domain-containing protein [Methanomicrobium sp.]
MSDEESYRKLFVAESVENHENIVNNILVLEEGSDDAAIDEIFRSAHTLKGMSASMGYMEMERLCHKMEDVFHSIRSGAIEISPELTDLLLACTDRIEEMIDDIEGGGDSSGIESEDLISKLKEIEAAANGEAKPESKPAEKAPEPAAAQPVAEETATGADDSSAGTEEAAAAPSTADSSSESTADAAKPASIPGTQQYKITAKVADECTMKDVRAMIVLQNLEDVGTIISSKPTAQELDEGIFESVLEVTIESDSGEDALRSAASVTDISEVTVEPIGAGNSSSPIYTIKLKIASDCSMKDVRAMLVLQNLEKCGSILSSNPNREQIDNGEITDTLEIVISSDKGEEELRKASSISDITEVVISASAAGSASQAPSPAPAPKQEAPAKETPAAPAAEAAEAKPRTAETASETQPAKAAGDEAKAKKEKAAATQAADKKKEFKNIRVDITRLDQMMNLVEDLVINGGRLKQIAKEHQIKDMDEALNMVSRSISDLQNLMMYIRMIPLSQIFNRFPRVVRDVAHHDGKEVDFIMTGGETELDRSVIDNLGDPLLHLIRNGVNHGLETPDVRKAAGKDPKGILKLSARREQGNVIIELTDDGAGINRQKVLNTAIKRGLISKEDAANYPDEDIPNFLFQPGFSTAEVITDISGRGVGLDVVKSAIESLKGSIKVETKEGEGTSFILTLPPTMAIIEVMMVRINDKRCAIPINTVVEIANVNFNKVTHIGKSEAILLRDEVLQINRLDQMFGPVKEDGIVVIVQYKGTKCCIPVDIVEGQQEVVVKPVSNIIGNCPGVGGVTIPGDGDVLPILDVNTMILN